MGSAWKDLERRVCRALGAERRPSVGPGGWARGSDDDGTAPFAVEVKRTKVLQLRSAWVMQARQNAKESGRPWLLVIGTHRTARPIAVLDFYALVQLAQEAGRLSVVGIEEEPESETGGVAMSNVELGVRPYGGPYVTDEADVPEPPTEPPPEEPAPEDDGDED